MADPKMTAQEHTIGVGAIMTNLLGLETVIRIFIARVKNQKWSLPTPGDNLVDENYLTNFRSLGPLIREYNALLSADEQGFRVDESVVDIRDALAHGRMLSVGDVFPLTLYKFGISQNGKIPITFRVELTTDWLEKTKLSVRDEQLKVVGCHKGRGYVGF